MPKLLFQGHGSIRLTTNAGQVIYLDPYAGSGYDLPADLILVTHQHHDHNHIELCAKKNDTIIITNVEALANNQYNSFNVAGILVKAVEAYNDNHNINECVGYLVEVDGVKIYFSGDTSQTKQMEVLAKENIDYAFFPGDGKYNMNPNEAEKCARLVGAKHNVLIHVLPAEALAQVAGEWSAPDKLVLTAGEEIEL